MLRMYRYEAFVLFLVAASVSCKYVPFYRRDYKYLEEYNAFYKLHQSANDWLSAFKTCDVEGAHLFYPYTKDETSVLLTMVTASGKNITSIVLGFRDDFHLDEFITIHGQPTPFPIDVNNEHHFYGSESSCVFLDIEMNYSKSGCNQKNSFICKRVIDTPECPTINKDYVYLEQTKRCYKVNNNKQKWWDALATCYKEGAFLLALDNAVEMIAVKYLLKSSQEHYLGIRRIARGDDFFTVKGSRATLDNIQWRETTGAKSNDCVALTRDSNEQNNDINDLFYNTVDCDTLLPFVCEMEDRA